MGSEAIRTQDLVINYVDDDVSKGALWMDSVGDGGAWKNGRMKEWLKKSGEKDKEEKKEVVVVGGEEQDDFLKALKNLSLSSSSASSLPTNLTLKKSTRSQN